MLVDSFARPQIQTGLPPSQSTSSSFPQQLKSRRAISTHAIGPYYSIFLPFLTIVFFFADIRLDNTRYLCRDFVRIVILSGLCLPFNSTFSLSTWKSLRYNYTELYDQCLLVLIRFSTLRLCLVRSHSYVTVMP